MCHKSREGQPRALRQGIRHLRLHGIHDRRLIEAGKGVAARVARAHTLLYVICRELRTADVALACRPQKSGYVA